MRGPVTHFFFSYARTDAVDDYIYTFFDELCLEVGARTGRAQDVGFLDKNQPPGSDWALTTGGALGTCDVFVPVYSSHFFASKYCGQEWHSFHARLDEHRRATGARPLCVVPVWWVPPLGGVPDATSWVQDTRDQFGADYAANGLRFLMRVTSRRNAYEEALFGLTQRIVDAAKAPARPVGVLDLERAPNAFAAATPPPPVRERPRGAVRGPRRVTFIVVAGGTERMRMVRTVLESYGEDWEDWRPYHPETPDPLALRAQGVALAQNMLSWLQPLDETLLDTIEAARERRELVVLLVDPWATGLEDYQRILARLNDRRYANTAVVVSWEALTADRGTAEEMLDECLSNWSDEKQVFHDNVQSMKEFETALAGALDEIRRRVVKQATKVRPVREPGPSSRPVVAGPGGVAS
ncbi:TIR-like protein FxsC [Streptomyces sp. H39-S7]|uniref:TIR-like protein FxsC n=1 Tax=Streptomyces sp. H39-S7 TaxID=3004357 RepID=UPI0022AF3ED6|nr:TIR-like protein FxsC [Streptomyces sp. H39-S7]MCZ4125925.1 TIR-like protein FxsC [Streptomyces sp. H39-S7]